MLFLIINKNVNKLSIAIPTYNSSSYLKDLLDSLMLLDGPYEIVLNDDNSSTLEKNKLNKIFDEYSKNKKLVLKLFENNENYGGFKNKYLAVSKCSSEFVYQIDSDNVPNIKLLQKLINKFDLTKYKNYLFLPASIYPFRFDHTTESKRKNKIVFSKKDLILESSDVKKMLNDKFTYKNIEYLLGLGNPIFHKTTYLKYLEEGLNSYEDVHAACSTALCYYWLKNKGSIHLTKNLNHFHRRHENSYFLKKESLSEKMAQSFRTKIKNL